MVEGNIFNNSSIKTRVIESLANTYDNSNGLDEVLNVYGKIINIDTTTSIVNIYGTAQNIVTTDLVIKGKVISLNLNESTNSGIDDGSYCGIEILNQSNNNGYIKTNNDNTKYFRKLPNNNKINSICVLDSNNNLVIDGKTT